MKRLVGLFITLVLVAGSCSKDKKLSTRIRGKILEAGTLEPMDMDSLVLRVVEGAPCGYPCFGTSDARHIADVEIIDGTYDFSFEASDDYHWCYLDHMNWRKNSPYMPKFKIFPGEDQVRDIILSQTVRLTWVFTDKGAPSDIVYISIKSSFYSGHTRWLEGLDSIPPPYTVEMSVTAGELYNFTVLMQDSTGQRSSSEYTFEIPYNEDPVVNIDI